MSGFVQPVTFYIPATAGEPVEVDVAHSGLKMVLASRESVRRLGDEWRVLGVYFLLGPFPGDAERFRAYVGEVGRRDLLTRVLEHAGQKDWWSRALLVTSASADGFNSAEIGWLEGRLYDVLNNAVAGEVMNKGRPGDDSIALKDRSVLERYVEPVMAALRACGAPPDTADQKPAPNGKKRAYYRESVKDLIEASLLKPGTRLRPLRRHLTTTALVLADGSLEVNGTAYGSVSSAAVAVSGNRSEPGWEFWGAPSGDGAHVPIFELRNRLRELQSPSLSAVRPEGDGQSPAPPPHADPGDHARTPINPATGGRRRRHFKESVKDLIDAGLVSAGEELTTVRADRKDRAIIRADGLIQMRGAVFTSLSTAAKAASGNQSEPGWEFWAVTREGQLVAMYRLRDRLRAQETET